MDGHQQVGNTDGQTPIAPRRTRLERKVKAAVAKVNTVENRKRFNRLAAGAVTGAVVLTLHRGQGKAVSALARELEQLKRSQNAKNELEGIKIAAEVAGIVLKAFF